LLGASGRTDFLTSQSQIDNENRLQRNKLLEDKKHEQIHSTQHPKSDNFK